MSAFNLIALDRNYQIISLLRPTNIQWNRKYHEPGTFSIQLPLEQYNPDIKYIYTKDRPEMGKVSQINYLSQSGFRYMQLSGYFIENELNRHVAYPKGASNLVNSPTWVEKSGNAEDVAYAFFDGFKAISTDVITSELNMQRAASLGRGKKAVHTRNGEYLGSKIYDILKPSGMSCRAVYDFESSKKRFEVWAGLDRTEENTDGNNPIVFSTKYGNIRNPNVLISEDGYKNACIVTNEQVSEDVSTYISRIVFNQLENEDIHIAYTMSSLNKADYAIDAEFLTALENEALTFLEETVRITNVEFDTSAASYEYMKDFDIGDKCTLEIPEMHLSLDARIVACYEVAKSGQWTMSLEFGTPIIKSKGGI